MKFSVNLPKGKSKVKKSVTKTFIYYLIVTYSMVLTDKLDKSEQSIKLFCDKTLISFENAYEGIERYRGRINNFFREVPSNPIKAFKQLYENVSTYFKK